MQARQGLGSFLIFLTLLSANLAVINFLPIPVLDGGHIVLLLYEGIRGKPADERVQGILTWIGIDFPPQPDDLRLRARLRLDTPAGSTLTRYYSRRGTSALVVQTFELAVQFAGLIHQFAMLLLQLVCRRDRFVDQQQEGLAAGLFAVGKILVGLRHEFQVLGNHAFLAAFSASSNFAAAVR